MQGKRQDGGGEEDPEVQATHSEDCRYDCSMLSYGIQLQIMLILTMIGNNTVAYNSCLNDPSLPH